MPKQSVQRKFKIRLTLSPMDDEKVIEFFKNKLNPVRLVIGRDDDASRPHYHVGLEMQISRNTLVKRMRDEFSLNGNKDFQCVEQDWDNKYIGYCIKSKRLCLHNVLEGDIIPWLTEGEYRQDKKKQLTNREKFMEYVQSQENPIADPRYLNELYVDFSRGYYKEFEAIACIRYALYNLGGKRKLYESTYDLIGNKFPGY